MSAIYLSDLTDEGIPTGLSALPSLDSCWTI
jgi:hypothetical protein